MPTDEEKSASMALNKAREHRDEQEIKEAFGARLSAKMEEKGYKDQDLADRAKEFIVGATFDRSMVSRYRHGKLPTPLRLRAMANALGVAPEYLLTPVEAKKARRTFHFEATDDGRIYIQIDQYFSDEIGKKIMALVMGAK